MDFCSFSAKRYFFLILLVLMQLILLVQPGLSFSSQDVIRLTIIPHRSNQGNEEAYKAFFSEMEKYQERDTSA